MTFTVRDAELSDVDAIYALGTGDKAFAVSEHISFYEKLELQEWIAERHDNILLVAESSEQPVGFLFCKIMSYHWALLDNFYVHSAWRGHGCGRQMIRELSARLRSRGTVYMSCLAASEDDGLSAYLQKLGFRRTKSYSWHENFLADSQF
jgi:ribosomal protein S18 acetylase RimI-like enzyme